MVSNEQLERLDLMASGREMTWDLSDNDCEAIADALHELLELRQREEWVKVSERLPEVGERVLVCYRGDTWTARREESRKKNLTLWLLPTGSTNVGVTHWRLLPAPPKEGL